MLSMARTGTSVCWSVSGALVYTLTSARASASSNAVHKLEGGMRRSDGRIGRRDAPEKRSTYVDDGTLDEQTCAAYFRALRDRFEDRSVPAGDAELTHHDALATHLGRSWMISSEEIRSFP